MEFEHILNGDAFDNFGVDFEPKPKKPHIAF